MRVLTIAALLFGGTTSMLPLMPGSDAAAQNRPGRAAGSAKSSINRPMPDRAAGSGQRGNGSRNASFNNQPNRNYNNRPNNNYNNRPAGRPNGNVVVVNNNRPPPRGGYYNNGGYYGGGNYNDNDNEFLEFVGKTAAITAGVSVVSAVIGSVVKDKPSGDCQQQMQNGQVYMLCNGVWYTPIQAGGQTNYQVVAPPAK